MEALDGKDTLAVSSVEGRFLYDLVKERNPKAILEVGTGHGYSTAWMNLARSKSSKFFSIDNEERPLVPGLGKVNFLYWRLPELIDSLPDSIDFIFLDSDHQIHNIVADIELLESRLSENGVVVIHDVLYCDEMGRCLQDYFAGIDSGRLKVIPVSPSKSFWEYFFHPTQYGLGIAYKRKGSA